MAPFRNILVHHYSTIDPDKVAKILYEDLSDFDDFEAYIYDYLKREGLLTDE